jgi:cytochrome c
MTTGEKKSAFKSAPIKGNWEIKPAAEQKEKGTYVMRAAYRDKGTASMKPLVGEEIIVLRYPNLNPELADFTKGFVKYITPVKSLNMAETGSYLAYKELDLTGLSAFDIKIMGNARNPTAGATVEIRIVGPDGPIIGKSDYIATTARGPIKTKINLTETTGKHTVYFVFVNEKATVGQTLVQIVDIEVLPKTTTPAPTTK